jgi:hypothetical protein
VRWCRNRLHWTIQEQWKNPIIFPISVFLNPSWCSSTTCRFCSGLISFVFLVMFETPFLQHLRFVYARRNYVTNASYHSRETWKCALYEQLPFTYRLLLYALFTSGKHTLRWQKYFTFCVHKVTLPDKNVLRLPINFLSFRKRNDIHSLMFIWVLRLAILSNLSSVCWPSAFTSGKHTLRWQKYFTFCVHKVTLPDKNVLRLPITFLTLIIT